jgi:hypothetical protein
MSNILLLRVGGPVAGGGGGVSTVTWNPADKGAGIDLSNGNLTASRNLTGSGSTYHSVRATVGKSAGKWQWRSTCDVAHGLWNGSHAIGLANASHNVSSDYLGSSNNSIGYHAGGVVWRSASPLATLATYTNGDVIGILWDEDGGTVQFNKNAGSWSSTFDISMLTGTVFPAWYAIFGSDVVTVDFSLSGVTLETGFSIIT